MKFPGALIKEHVTQIMQISTCVLMQIYTDIKFRASSYLDSLTWTFQDKHVFYLSRFWYLYVRYLGHFNKNAKENNSFIDWWISRMQL